MEAGDARVLQRLLLVDRLLVQSLGEGISINLVAQEKLQGDPSHRVLGSVATSLGALLGLGLPGQ